MYQGKRVKSLSFEKWKIELHNQIQSLTPDTKQKSLRIKNILNVLNSSLLKIESFDFNTIPDQDLQQFYQHGEFADGNYIIYEDNDFIILIHENKCGITNIHSHGFEGYFRCLLGEVTEEKYLFTSKEVSPCGEMSRGEISKISQKIILDEFTPIGNNLHQVEYKAQRNFTICLREKNDQNIFSVAKDDFLLKYSPLKLSEWSETKKAIANNDFSVLSKLSLGQLVGLSLLPKPNKGPELFIIWAKIQKYINDRIKDVKWN